MESDYIKALDEYFCAQYSDYTKISAIEGYEMPEVLSVGADGNIERKDAEVMRLSHQRDADKVLASFKRGLADTEFTFNFSFRPFRDRVRDPFRKFTFAKLLPAALSRAGETAESVGEKLALSDKIWKSIVKGKVYPEKNTVVAVALVSAMKRADVVDLMNVLGYTFSRESVRDVVCEYLLQNGIYNPEMIRGCLHEYKITTLPIKDVL